MGWGSCVVGEGDFAGRQQRPKGHLFPRTPLTVDATRPRPRPRRLPSCGVIEKAGAVWPPSSRSVAGHTLTLHSAIFQMSRTASTEERDCRLLVGTCTPPIEVSVAADSPCRRGSRRRRRVVLVCLKRSAKGPSLSTPSGPNSLKHVISSGL